EHETLAALSYGGGEGGRVPAGVRLDDRQRHELLATRHRRQPLPFLPRRAQGGEPERARDRGEDAERSYGPAALFEQEAEVEEGGAGAAVRGRQSVAEPAEARDRLPEFRVVPGRVLVPGEAPLARDLAGEEAPRLALDRRLVRRGREMHVLLAWQTEPPLGDDHALDLVGSATEALHRGDGVQPLEAAVQRGGGIVGGELTVQAEDVQSDGCQPR